MKIVPCFYCDNRSAECHAGCNDYINWSKALSEAKKAKQTEDVIDYVCLKKVHIRKGRR